MLEAIGGWFADLFRTIFLYLDFVVYWLVDQIYILFVTIADTGLFSPQTIQDFGGRIYILLSIIMIFIVSFSMIKYIINPDDFLSEKKGVTQLIKNFFIVLIAIVAVPSVFSLAFELQSIILKENFIPKIVLGSNIDTPTMTVDGEKMDQITFGGKTMAATVFSAFFKPNQDQWKGCSYPEYDSCGDVMDATKVLKSELGNAKDVLGVINAGIVNEKIEPTYADAEDDEVYAIEYTFLISAIAGCFLVYVLLVFCIDISIRAVKLGFLQLIAPVPIVSLLDPREKGSGMFNKWVKTVISTFMGLFIRLIAIYFAIAVVILITAGGAEFYRISDNTPMDNIFVRVFIIFGALLFAKELPKLLEDLVGVKFDGGSMNLKKRLQSAPGLGAAKAAAFGAGGLVGAGVGSAIGNYRATKEWNADADKSGKPELKRSALMSAIGGGLAGAGRGAVSGATGGRAGIDSAIEKTRANQERNAKAMKADYGAGARNKDRFAAATGGKTLAQQMEDDYKDFETKNGTYTSTYTDPVTGQTMTETHSNYYQSQEELFQAQQELSTYQGFYDDGLAMKNDRGETVSFADSSSIESQRQVFMDEYTATPGTSAEQEALEKREWAASRLAEKTGVSEADWQKYEQKVKAKDNYRSKEKEVHLAQSELTKRKIAAEKQKKLQDSYKIGAKKEVKKKK